MSLIAEIEGHEGEPGPGETTAVRTVEPVQTGPRRVTVRKPGPHARLIVLSPFWNDDRPPRVLRDVRDALAEHEGVHVAADLRRGADAGEGGFDELAVLMFDDDEMSSHHSTFASDLSFSTRVATSATFWPAFFACGSS